MSPISLGVQAIKIQFFTGELRYSMQEGEYQFLMRVGREIHRSSNRSMLNVGDKRLKKYWEFGGEVPPAKPGKPPRARKGLLKTQNRYGYWAQEHAVVIGPRLIKGGGYGRQPYPAPGLEEHGGTTYIPTIKKRAHYPARPYMRPAHDRTMARVASGRIKLRLRHRPQIGSGEG